MKMAMAPISKTPKLVSLSKSSDSINLLFASFFTSIFNFDHSSPLRSFIVSDTSFCVLGRQEQMAGGSSKSTPKPRKRVDVASTSAAAATLVRAKDGSAFAKCEECSKDVPVALISMHSCSLDAKIKMNLEAQVVELPAEAKKKPVERKRPTTSGESKPKKLKKLKKGADPDAPKRPPTAFFLFMDDFRKSYKEENPDAKGGKEVASKGGEKWKLMTEEEKKAYTDRAAELKAEYEKAMVVWKEKNENENQDDDRVSDKEEASEAEVESQEKKEGEEDLDDY